MDYTIFYKKGFEDGNIHECASEYDIFFSGFDNCERTKSIFGKIKSDKKYWINFPHYHIKPEDLPSDQTIYNHASFKEDEFFIDLFKTLSVNADSRICIDITGFIRPHLVFFIKYLYLQGVKKLDCLYTEPKFYKNAEDTTFSGFIDEVKIIEGCGSAIINPQTDNDLLIITAGYDDKLIAKVSQYKSKVKQKYYILGFPSLQPDMYQESILKIFNAKESIGAITTRYAPAFDPFVTAQTIETIIGENPDYSNIYLSPLSTKPQALGIVFYYLWNFQDKPVNIIFPYSNNYFPKTAYGINKTWKYTLQFP